MRCKRKYEIKEKPSIARLFYFNDLLF